MWVPSLISLTFYLPALVLFCRCLDGSPGRHRLRTRRSGATILGMQNTVVAGAVSPWSREFSSAFPGKKMRSDGARNLSAEGLETTGVASVHVRADEEHLSKGDGFQQQNDALVCLQASTTIVSLNSEQHKENVVFLIFFIIPLSIHHSSSTRFRFSLTYRWRLKTTYRWSSHVVDI